MTVSCDDFPIAKVTNGKWGDDYATIRLEGPSVDTKAVAVMEQITYGEVSKETAVANARLIAAAPDMLEALNAYQQARRWATGTHQHRTALEIADACAATVLAAISGERNTHS